MHSLICFIWLSQTVKCFCVLTKCSFLDLCIWKGFASKWWNATYFFLCSLLLKYCGLHLSAPDKPKSYPLLCWLLVLTSSTVCNRGNMPVWLQCEPDPCLVVYLGGPGGAQCTRFLLASMSCGWALHWAWQGWCCPVCHSRATLLSCVLCLTKAM